jgi:hypothetical protein
MHLADIGRVGRRDIALGQTEPVRELFGRELAVEVRVR